jgi:hypothetical protein
VRKGRRAALAIYHCSLKVFSRSKGHSAVAAAAYRSGSMLYDERAGKTHRYDKRSGVAETFILLPHETPCEFYQENSGPSGLPDRAALWNAVEQAEKRKNSCVARELILALPHELSDAGRADLTKDMALYLMERYRVAVDSAIHAPAEGDGHDHRNHHAHILFSTRELTSSGFGAKTRILDDKVTGKEETELIREVWETLANEALVKAGHSDVQIDRRSLEEQGVDRIPQTHVGAVAGHASDYIESKYRSEDEDDSESAEDGDETKSSGGSSSGGGGGSSLSLDLEPAELKNAATEGQSAHRKGESLTRMGFVEEIKALNAVRAGYSDVPLKQQIAHIDKLMVQLDVRVGHLERLKERSSLSSSLKRAMGTLLELSSAAILNRQKSSRLSDLSADEKQARSARQKKRYGRTYRAGLHQQIKEMKHNLYTLKTKSQEYNRYRGFVEKIEAQMNKPSLQEGTSLSSAPTKMRAMSNEESSLKLALKANMARENVPNEYRAQAENKLGALKVKSEKVRLNTLNEQEGFKKDTPNIETKKSIENNNLYASSNINSPLLVGAGVKAESERARTAFNMRAALNPNIRPDPQALYKQKIKNFDPLKWHAAQEKDQGIKVERSSWFTPKSDKSKPMMDQIASSIAERRRAPPEYKQEKQHDPNTMKGQFNVRVSAKLTSNEAHRAKTRMEAKIKRSQVPPEYRASPYPSQSHHKPENGPQERGLKSRVKSRFKAAKGAVGGRLGGSRAGDRQFAPESPAKSSRAKMSAGFNEAGADNVGREHEQSVSTDYDDILLE